MYIIVHQDKKFLMFMTLFSHIVFGDTRIEAATHQDTVGDQFKTEKFVILENIN